MNAPVRNPVRWTLLALLLVLASLSLECAKQSTPAGSEQTATTTAPPCPPSILKPAKFTIVIEKNGSGGIVEPIACSRTRQDYVRWANKTDVSYAIVFRGAPTEPTYPGCPFTSKDTIFVGPRETTTYRYIDPDTTKKGEITYKYVSVTGKLEGPPDTPGMTVDD